MWRRGRDKELEETAAGVVGKDRRYARKILPEIESTKTVQLPATNLWP